MMRKNRLARAVLWAATMVCAVLLHADALFKTILLPLLATAAFLLVEEDPWRRRARRCTTRPARAGTESLPSDAAWR